MADGFRIVFIIIGLLVVVAGLALNSVVEPGRLRMLSSNPTPYGYTTSLLLFFLPVASLGWWFMQHSKHRPARKAFWKTILILIPSGFVLDLLFGNLFFQFPNLEATLGLGIPAIGGPIPVEEFMFYVGGFLAVLLCYIWADEYWLARYKETRPSPAGRSSLVQFHSTSVAVGVVAWAVAVLYRKHGSTEPDGFPWYFTYLVLAAIVPSAGFFRMAQPWINWRAFSFTLLLILLVSVVWEVTLAVPYGWWGYQPEAMMGLRIQAWSDLPIEAVAVWLVVTFDTVIIYEVIKRSQRARASDSQRARALQPFRLDLHLHPAPDRVDGPAPAETSQPLSMTHDGSPWTASGLSLVTSTPTQWNSKASFQVAAEGCGARVAAPCAGAAVRSIRRKSCPAA